MSSSSTISTARAADATSYSQAPPGYETPRFPGLYWPPQIPVLHGSLYYLYDIWRFTLLWTTILYAIFHMGAAVIALATQLMFSGRPEYWRYLWTIPVVYTVVAGVEALFAGSFVGLVIGAAYLAGPFWMSTWIPFVWGWANVLILIISSFSIQGGL